MPGGRTAAPVVPKGIPLYDNMGRLLGLQPAEPIRPAPAAAVPQGIPLYDVAGNLVGFQPGVIPTTSRVTSTPTSSTTPPGQGSVPGLTGSPSFVQAPILSGAFMPPPQVQAQISSSGGAFGMILAYLTVPPDIRLALLNSLDMHVNESYVVMLGLRDEELDNTIADLRVGGKPIPIGMRSRIRMAV